MIWAVFDAAYLLFALGTENYPLMLLFYGIRGFGYPLFAFGFLVWITNTAPKARLGTAVGWFYFAFTGGLPTLGSLWSSLTIPWFGRAGHAVVRARPHPPRRRHRPGRRPQEARR